MPTVGVRDQQTVDKSGGRAGRPKIAGVEIHDLSNIITRSGFMTEIFRTDWSVVDIEVHQVNWVQLSPGAVTDWHVHVGQKDHLVGVNGTIKLALWDGREDSETKGATEIVRMGAFRPVMVIVPPGVWHGLRNESGEHAGYINVIDTLYFHERPDNWRLAPNATDIPNVL